MKFLMNGCLLLATDDGSTNEIIEEIGAENMVIANLLQNPVISLLLLYRALHMYLSVVQESI